MKVVSRFAALFFVLSSVGLLLASWFAARREVGRAEARTADDVVAFADVLEASIVSEARHGGVDDAVRVVEAASARSPSFEARFVTGVAARPSTSSIDEANERRLMHHVRTVRARDASVLGVLEVTHGLPTRSAIVRAALTEEVGFALGLGLVAGALVFGLGHLLIGAPLGRVVAQARRIASEDFTGRLPEDRTDEIGLLKRELNLMCDKLDLARKRLADEATAHVETLEQLRHLDRLRTVGTLASAVAHELGTPFNVVLLRAESLTDASSTETDRAEAVRVIVAQVAKMSRTVRQLLDFSRDSEAQRKKVALRELLGEIERLLGPLAKKHGVTLETDSAVDTTLVADPLRLEQMVTNLVMNAVAASPPGTRVTMRLAIVESAVRPGFANAVGAARIDIVDRGQGMSEENLARIFEPFYTTKAEGRGTGLGLTVATGIAEDHGGWLSATSEIGRGSTFSVYLPLP